MKKRLITPELAKEWLKKAHKFNRDIRAERVATYAEKMRNGTFNVVSDRPDSANVISFCKGVLLDGHHRLHACVKANVSFLTWVNEDAGADEFLKINTGENAAQRHLKDILVIDSNMTGQPRPKCLVACAQTVKLVHFYNEGVFFVMPDKNTRTVQYSKGTQMGEFLHTWKINRREIETCINTTMKIKGVMSHGIAAALCFAFRQRDHKTAEDFFESLRNGGAGKNHPITNLQRRLVMAKGAKSSRDSLNSYQVIEYSIKTWNLLRRGVTEARSLPPIGGSRPVVE